MKDYKVKRYDGFGREYIDGLSTGKVFLIMEGVTPEYYNNVKEWFVRTFNPLGDFQRR